MKRRFRLFLAIYLVLIFTTLPLLPPVAAALRKTLGEGPFSALLFIALAAAGLAPTARLRRIPRPLLAKPAGAYLLLLLGGAAIGLVLASSPVGRIHLAEYALLGFLFVRALPDGPGGQASLLPAFAAAALTGLVDETVQYFLPNRFFDWYDVALNSAAALLGVLFSSWWDLTGKLRAASCRDDSPAPEGS